MALEAVLQLWPQWLAASIVCLLSVTMGMVTGWTSPYLAQLTGEDSPLPITEEQASWIASLMPLGRLFGAVLGSVAVEILGSKRCLVLTGVPLIVSWVCVIAADSAIWLYVFRILSGVSMGMIFSCFPLYVGEISAASVRGALVGLVINGLPLGTLIGNIMGPNMSMMTFGIIGLIMNLVYAVIFPFLPQTPHHFVRQDDLDGASAAIRWYYRRSAEDIRLELEAVQQFVSATPDADWRDRLREMTLPKNRRAFVVIILLFIFMQISGLNTVIFYMEIITANAGVTSIAPSTVVIIVNTIGIIMGFLGLYAVDVCGRRILLALSSCGVIIGMTMLSVHFGLLDVGFDPGNLEWLPILGLIIFMFLCAGLVPVPSTLLGELFQADLKSIAGFVGSATSAVFAFLASKTYQPLVWLMSEKYVFAVHAVLMVACLVYTLLGVPETKGKTLQEIQEMLATETEPRTREQENSIDPSEAEA